MVRSHIAQRGRNAGDYTVCKAKVNACPFADSDNHAEFAGMREMDEYNRLMAVAPDFRDNSMTPTLFGASPGMGVDGTAINRWNVSEDGEEVGAGGFRFVRVMGRDVSALSSSLRSGGRINERSYENTVEVAHDAENRIWGGDGLATSPSGDYETQGSTIVGLGPGWALRMTAPATAAAPSTGYDLFSNGSTAVSVETDLNTNASNAIILARNHPNVARRTPVDSGYLHLATDVENIGDALDTIGEAVDGKYGYGSSMYIDGDTVTVLHNDRDGTKWDVFPLHDLHMELGTGLPRTHAAVKTLEGTRL